MRFRLALLLGVTALLLVGCGGSKANAPREISTRGSLGFWFHIDRDYYNGIQPQGDLVRLIEAPGVLKIDLDTPSISNAAAAAAFVDSGKTEEHAGPKPPSSIVNLEITWLGDKGANFYLQIDRLPGPGWYYLAYRWDSEQGIFDGFLNGTPFRLPGAKLTPWPITPQTVQFTIAENVEKFETSQNLWSDEEIKSRVAKRKCDDMSSRIGFAEKKPMEDVEPVKGKLLYAPDFSRKGVFDTWRMEGPGVTRIEDGGWLHMESALKDSAGLGTGHFVYWPPEVVPTDFVAEWEFQPLSDEGLCIVFLAAKGQKGEHLFDPALAKRNGTFRGYIQGDINCYHISYFANAPDNPGRTTSNMRKNNGFYLVANGPMGIPGGSRDIHKVTLVKRKGHVQLGVDGQSIIDWTDDGVQYGPVLGEGQIGFRQMKWTVGRYRNFKVWEVKGI